MSEKMRTKELLQSPECCWKVKPTSEPLKCVSNSGTGPIDSYVEDFTAEINMFYSLQQKLFWPLQLIGEFINIYNSSVNILLCQIDQHSLTQLRTLSLHWLLVISRYLNVSKLIMCFSITTSLLYITCMCFLLYYVAAQLLLSSLCMHSMCAYKWVDKLSNYLYVYTCQINMILILTVIILLITWFTSEIDNLRQNFDQTTTFIDLKLVI